MCQYLSNFKMRKRKTSSKQHRNCNITMDCVIIIDKHRHRQRTLNSAYSLYKYSCLGSWKRLPHTESTQSGINNISSHAGRSSSSLLSLPPENFCSPQPHLGRRDTLPWCGAGVESEKGRSLSCDMLTSEHPPPYHILPRGSYLIIQQDSLGWTRSDIMSLNSFTLLNIYSNSRLLADSAILKMGTRDKTSEDLLYSTKF